MRFKRSGNVNDMPNPHEFIVQMSDLASEETYIHPDGSSEPVLSGNTLDVRRGEAWGIIGDEPFEIQLLLEIIACVRAYGAGRCKLAERGMMRKKRQILPHVYFVSDSDVVVPNMNALEYVMFATANCAMPARERQTIILDMLLKSGMHGCTLMPTKFLSKSERSILSLLAASFSEALLIVFSAATLALDEPMRQMVKLIAERVIKTGRALVIGGTDAELAQIACTHAAFLIKGNLAHKGTVDEMLAALDKRRYIIKCDELDELKKALGEKLPFLALSRRGDFLDVYNYSDQTLAQNQLLEALEAIDLPISDVRLSRRTLENAFQEAL